MKSSATKSPLKPAATIILARPAQDNIEIYLLKRSEKLKFMGGLYVFPGGGVAPSDRDLEFWKPRIDLAPRNIENRIQPYGIEPDAAMGFYIAAVRETLEEAGVFLAEPENKTAADYKSLSQKRLSVNLGENWFQDVVQKNRWRLTLSSLMPWSRWITPERMKVRFDTLFFIARMPESQVCQPDQRETTAGIWISPRDALDENIAGEIPMSPPTLTTLTQLCDICAIQDLFQPPRTDFHLKPVMPRMVRSEKGPVVLMPWDPIYHSDLKQICLEDPVQILPAGTSFSRVWNCNGRWFPVSGDAQEN